MPPELVRRAAGCGIGVRRLYRLGSVARIRLKLVIGRRVLDCRSRLHRHGLGFANGASGETVLETGA